MRIGSGILKATVSAAFLYLLYRVVRGHNFAGILRGADPLYFALSLLIAPVLLVTSCAKWKLLLDAQGCRVPFPFLIRVYLIGYYFSNLLPSMVGGDIVRLYYAGKRVGSHGHAAASIFLERFTGVLLLLALVALAPAIRPALYLHPAVWIPAAGAAALLAALFLMMRMRNPFTRLFGAAARWTGRRAAGVTAARVPAAGRFLRKAEAGLGKLGLKAEAFHLKLATGTAVLRTDRAVLWKVIVLTVLFYLLAGINVWFAFKTFGAAPPVWDVISVLPTAMLVAMIPIAMGSLGITETSYVFYFGLLGMLPATTVAMALLMRLKLILLGLIGLIAYLSHGERFQKDSVPLEMESATPSPARGRGASAAPPNP
ncbi:MAG: hypothetical protein BWK77_05565 [Verrucomicrobia bacterium A1]|nr:MAG: hypothetical protein BWK77_05565 [Verrucomicrobia bacterium A1]